VKSTEMNRMYRMYIFQPLMGKKVFFLSTPPFLGQKGCIGVHPMLKTLIIINIYIYISCLDEPNVYGCTYGFI